MAQAEQDLWGMGFAHDRHAGMAITEQRSGNGSRAHELQQHKDPRISNIEK